MELTDWFLTESERDNPHTDLPVWCDGQSGRTPGPRAELLRGPCRRGRGVRGRGLRVLHRLARRPRPEGARRGADHWPSCSAPRRSVASSSRAWSGGRTWTNWPTARRRTGIWARRSSAPEARCCWISGSGSADRIIRSWWSSGTRRTPIATSPSRAESICATRAATTNATSAMCKRFRCRPGTVTVRRGTTSSCGCGDRSWTRSTPRSASAGAIRHRWTCCRRSRGCATSSAVPT